MRPTAISTLDRNEQQQHDSRLIIHWREQEPYDTLWVIRGLDPTGQYYGEVVVSSLPSPDNGTQKSGMVFSGQLTATETVTVIQAAELLRGTLQAAATTKRFGLIAEGNYSKPRIIYEYYLERSHLPNAAHFTRVISVFRPHFLNQLQELLKLVSDSSGPISDQND